MSTKSKKMLKEQVEHTSAKGKDTSLLWPLPLKLWLVSRSCGGASCSGVLVVSWAVMEEQRSKLAIILLHDILTIKIIICAVV